VRTERAIFINDSALRHTESLKTPAAPRPLSLFSSFSLRTFESFDLARSVLRVLCSTLYLKLSMCNFRDSRWCNFRSKWHAYCVLLTAGDQVRA